MVPQIPLPARIELVTSVTQVAVEKKARVLLRGHIENINGQHSAEAPRTIHLITTALNPILGFTR